VRQKPTDKTVKRLFAGSGGVCAFPGCTTPLVDPQSGALLGEMCHISAAAPDGPRYDPHLSDAERSDAKNLIILCPTHHTLIDQDVDTYSAAFLRKMKAQHEAQVAATLGVACPGINNRQAADFARQIVTESVDFAVVVALPKELAALLHYFPELEQLTIGASSRSYYRGVIPTVRGISYRVVATLLHSMGNLEASHATADIIRDWNPRYVLVNGLAGGLCRTKQDFGDIVASDSIVYYEPAKLRESGCEHRNRQFPADPTLLDGILNLTDSDWRMRLPVRPDGRAASSRYPSIHIGPIASGEKVIAASDEADRLRMRQPNLVAVEMESAGVASAAFSAVKKVGFLTIRSICDFADSSKDDRWHEYAARCAASCLRGFLQAGLVAPSEGAWPKTSPAISAPRPLNLGAMRKQLFDRLCGALDMEEFKNLCFLLGVDVDELPGDRKSARVRELILLFERRGQLKVLEDAVDDNIRNDCESLPDNERGHAGQREGFSKVLEELRAAVFHPMKGRICLWQIKESDVLMGVKKPKAEGYYPILIGLEALVRCDPRGSIKLRDDLISWSLSEQLFIPEASWFIRGRKGDPGGPREYDIRHTAEVGSALLIDGRATHYVPGIVKNIVREQGRECAKGAWLSTRAAPVEDPLSTVTCCELVARAMALPSLHAEDLGLSACLQAGLQYLEAESRPRGWGYEGLKGPFWEPWGASIVGFRLRHWLTDSLRDRVIESLMTEIESTNLLVGEGYRHVMRVRMLARYLCALSAVEWRDPRLNQWLKVLIGLWNDLDPAFREASTMLHIAYLFLQPHDHEL